MLVTFALGLASVWFCGNIQTTANDEVMIVTMAPRPPRFTESFRACGMGYLQGYLSNDGIELTEGGLGCVKPKKRDKRVVQIDNERIISKIESDNKTYYEIYQLENGHCINSPSIEIGIELEKFLKNNKR